MKRYIIFSFDYYDPGGGCEHIHGFYDTEEECNAELEKISEYQTIHIFDTHTMTYKDIYKFKNRTENKKIITNARNN